MSYLLKNKVKVFKIISAAPISMVLKFIALKFRGLAMKPNYHRRSVTKILYWCN
jgi:hypothetical protein